jgi:hypothetical protein
MLQSISKWTRSVKRYFQLAGFWRRRTTFYRDAATSLQERELFKNFVAGELNIATAEKTQDKDRAKGLAYLQDMMHATDLSLHEALAKVMPNSDSLSIGTLSHAKSVPAALRDLAENIDRQTEMTQMIRRAIASPVLLLPIAYVFSYVLSSVSIPEFVKAAPPEVWTFFNSLVRDAANLIHNYGHWVALGIVLGLCWVFIWGLPNLTMDWRYRMESSRGYKRLFWIFAFPFQPIFSLYRDVQGTRMLGNLANLMQSGMLLKEALKTLSVGAQPWMRKHLAIVHEHLDIAPGDYVGAFSHGVLPVFILGRMGSLVRRNTGDQFDKVLIELGTTGIKEATVAVQSSAVKINAILLTVALGTIVFFYGGQQSIAFAIQEANSPTAVMRRQIEKLNTPVPSDASTQSQPAKVGGS